MPNAFDEDVPFRRIGENASHVRGVKPIGRQIGDDGVGQLPLLPHESSCGPKGAHGKGAVFVMRTSNSPTRRIVDR